MADAVNEEWYGHQNSYYWWSVLRNLESERKRAAQTRTWLEAVRLDSQIKTATYKAEEEKQCYGSIEMALWFLDDAAARAGQKRAADAARESRCRRAAQLLRGEEWGQVEDHIVDEGCVHVARDGDGCRWSHDDAWARVRDQNGGNADAAKKDTYTNAWEETQEAAPTSWEAGWSASGHGWEADCRDISRKDTTNWQAAG